MQIAIITLNVFIAVNKACTSTTNIKCLTEESCASTPRDAITLHCPPNQDCIIECSGLYACYGTTINCPENADCKIFCSAYGACYNINIDSSLSTHLFITTVPIDEDIATNTSSLFVDMEGAINGDILCPFCGDCEVEYVGEQAGYDKVSINATYSTSLNVYAAGGDEVFQSGSLYCPQGG
eukprot:321555_1